jgi:hypothetical protein
MPLISRWFLLVIEDIYQERWGGGVDKDWRGGAGWAMEWLMGWSKRCVKKSVLVVLWSVDNLPVSCPDDLAGARLKGG